MKNLLIGERYREKLEIPLHNLGFSPFWLPKNPELDPRLGFHTDLSVFLYDKNIVLSLHLYNINELVNLLTNRGYTVLCCEKEQKTVYPDDVNLCAAVVGDRLLHNSKYTDKIIKSIQSLKPLHINQGYARCTLLSVGDGIITADQGIANKAEAAGIDVLRIRDGEIELDGFDTGFIGGASFVAGNTVYFTGDIYKHPDSDAIAEFISRHGLSICSLTSGALFDIGGAVYLK